MKRLVLCGGAAAALAMPGAAGAAAPAADGTSTLTLSGAAAKALTAQGVKVSAVAPAKAKNTKITLPVRTAAVGGSATLTHDGAIRLRKGARSITLKAPTVTLARQGRLTATVGKATISVLTVDAARRALNAGAGSAALKGGTVKLTSKGAAAIRGALKLRSLRAGGLGTLTVDAKRAATGSGPNAPGGTTTPGGPTTPGGATTPGGTTTPGSPRCDTATAPGGPAPLARPLTAVDVTAASITWHVRESFIQYIAAGEGTWTCNGATPGVPTTAPGNSASLVYDFGFAFKDGWYDPVSQTGRVTFSGTVVFRYSGHTIRLSAVNPEIEIAGGASRGVFTTVNGDETPSRGVLEDLDLGGAASITHSPDGTSHIYSQVPGKIPADAGASTFAGFYQAGDPFGWVTLQATTA